MGETEIRWLSIFADVPGPRLDAACAFWTAVTGTTPGRPAGERSEYVPLDPRDGDRHLWLQRLEHGEQGWHADLHVGDPDAAAATAHRLGAVLVRRAADLRVLRSPGGLAFCLVAEDAGRPRRRAEPPRWPGGRSLLDQLSLDIPGDRFEDECDFWSALTGWPRRGRDDAAPEFDRLITPPHLPAQFLLQRLDPGAPDPIHAHADLSADDRDAEVARHECLGAEVIRRTAGWTTLRDPVGLVYCVTGRPTGVRST